MIICVQNFILSIVAIASISIIPITYNLVCRKLGLLTNTNNGLPQAKQYISGTTFHRSSYYPRRNLRNSSEILKIYAIVKQVKKEKRNNPSYI